MKLSDGRELAYVQRVAGYIIRVGRKMLLKIMGLRGREPIL